MRRDVLANVPFFTGYGVEIGMLVDVYEPDVPRVKLGQAVRITLPCCPLDKYEGTVANIGAAVGKSLSVGG